MKRFLLFFAIGFFTIGICKIGATPTDSAFYFAQSTTWTTSLRAMFGGCDDWTKTCVMQGDTLIGDDTYHNLWYDDGRRQLIIPIREDNKRIFAYLDNQDVLLYDFNLEVGDSISVCVLSGEQILCLYYTHVTSTDTITLSDGRKAKRLAYDLDRLPDIEYVGCEYGIFAAIIPVRTTTCGYTNSCCSLNGEPIYETSPGTCASLNPAPPVCADTWHAIDYIKVAGKVYSVTDAVYNLTSDTIINEQTYRKLVRNNSTCVGALRQTEDGMKVYFFDLQSGYSHTPQEYLLYDFSASVGDTIDAYFSLDDMPSIIDHMGEPEYIGWLVIEKGTIDGRITMLVARCSDDSISSEISESSLLDYHTRWIQGVGTSHVLWPAYYGVVGMSELFTLCAMHGDETLYTYDLESLGIENNCTEWHFTALDDIPADNSRNRKFLHNGHIYIETPLGTFDATGRKAE